MGVTVSHTAIAPLSMVSVVFGFISFTFTVATFLNVFWSSVQTIHAAPSEIPDYLSNLKQGLLEERRHLRKVGRRLRSARRGRSGSDSEGGDGPRLREKSWARAYEKGGDSASGAERGGKKRPRSRPHFSRDEQAFRSAGERDTIRVLRTAIRDMIRSFRSLEAPFLKPEFQNLDSTHWSTNTPSSIKPVPSSNLHMRAYLSDDEADSHHLNRSDRLGNEYRTCNFRQRYLWWRRKPDVVRLSEGLSRVEIRRMAHEVGTLAMMVRDLGRDLEHVSGGVGRVEGRLGRVVGVRRVD